MNWKLVPIIAAMISMSTSESRAEDCPTEIVKALRLVVVTASAFDQSAAILETYERTATAAPWQAVGAMRQAVVGLKGVAWGAGFRHFAAPGEPLKEEGDKRSPIGIYAIGAPFGADAQSLPGYMMLEMGRHICVEEPRSQSYGRIVDKSSVEPGTKFDEMAAEPLYRRGVVVDYPADAANKAGSCIFIHVWRQPGKGTAGCIGMDESYVADLRAWVSAKPSAIAILTPAAKARFRRCLP